MKGVDIMKNVANMNDEYAEIARKIAKLVKELDDLQDLIKQELKPKQIQEGLLLLKISIEESIVALIQGKKTITRDTDMVSPENYSGTSAPSYSERNMKITEEVYVNESY